MGGSFTVALSAPLLSTGNYEIRAELAGFQTGVRRGIRLLVGQEAVVDFTLEIGSITEEVVVTGEAPLVNTTSSTLSSVISERQVHDLPLNSRNITQLALLTPGVVQLRTGITGGVTLGAPSVRISIAGAKFYSTGFLLDGTDVTDSSRGMGPGGAAGSDEDDLFTPRRKASLLKGKKKSRAIGVVPK